MSKKRSYDDVERQLKNLMEEKKAMEQGVVVSFTDAILKTDGVKKLVKMSNADLREIAKLFMSNLDTYIDQVEARKQSKAVPKTAPAASANRAVAAPASHADPIPKVPARSVNSSPAASANQAVAAPASHADPAPKVLARSVNSSPAMPANRAVAAPVSHADPASRVPAGSMNSAPAASADSAGSSGIDVVKAAMTGQGVAGHPIRAVSETVTDPDPALDISKMSDEEILFGC